MSGRFVRASKYRHVFGQKAKKEASYENLKISTNAFDANLIKANEKYLGACWQASGGGAFAVIPLSEVGKAPDLVPLFRTTATVLDLEFDPFNDQIIASSGDDGKITIWEIPEDYSFHHFTDENDNIKDLTQPKKVLSGHKRKVGHIKYNPVAQDILASSSIDYSVKIWNVATGEVIATLQHKDVIQSFDWNYNGTLIATTSRDKTLRIWDARNGTVISEGPGHGGAKAARVVWMGQADRIATTGFSKLSDRQLGVWDTNSIKDGPIGGFYTVDLSAGILMPVYDASTKMLYVAGKGDGNIRYFEFENDELYQLSEYQSTDPQRGFAAAPKKAVNVHENEVLKVYKSCGNDSTVEPISFICPRKGDFFQDDIYPDCPSGSAALTSDEWVGGKTVNGPLLITMESLFEGTTPQLKETAPVSRASPASAATVEASSAHKEEALSKPEPVSAPVSKVSESSIQSSSQPTAATSSSNIDDLLKSSSEVNSMLDKVNQSEDSSDDDRAANSEDDEWNPKTKSKEPTTEKKEATSPSTNTSAFSKQSTPEEASKVEPQQKKEAIEKLNTEKTASTEKSPAPVSDDATKPVSKVAGAASGLKQNVEKLAQSVDTLEKIIGKLINSGLEKDERLKSLEEKIDQLLQK